MSKKTRLAIFILLSCAAFLFLGCSQEKKMTQEKTIIPVKVEKIVLKDLDDYIDYVGNIKAQEEAIVYPKVNGKIFEKIKEDGSPVDKGEVIAYIDRDEVGFKFEKAPVESPLTGIIGRVYVDLGENVTVQTPIALVVDMRRMEIDLDIPEKYLGQAALGQSAKISVDTYPREEFTGKVTKISPIVDLSTRAAPVQITVDNKEQKLRSGMFAKVNLIIAQYKNVPVIAKEAVLGKDPNLYVYIIENKKAILRKIMLGIRSGQDFEVKDGLKAGDFVVVMGQQKLYEGAEVLMEEAGK